VTKDDLHLLLSRKVGVDEVRTLLSERSADVEFKRDFNNLWSKTDDLARELSEMSRNCLSRNE